MGEGDKIPIGILELAKTVLATLCQIKDAKIPEDGPVGGRMNGKLSPPPKALTFCLMRIRSPLMHYFLQGLHPIDF